MKRLFCLMLLVWCLAGSVWAQTPYQPNWTSLDQRPVPEWFKDAKLGIFIHWGPYSVPAWAPKGVYAEWYQYWLETKTLFGNGQFQGDEIYKYHRQKYGTRSYYDLAAQFKAENYHPEEWIKLFERAGAKYLVITSKHHDGYTLWPNEQANDRGFPWNSQEVGPQRDLLGALRDAAAGSDLKFGIYYSLYEWFHPWYKSGDVARYVNEHMLPQVKDLVNRYQPDILWSDGDWEQSAETWKSPELLAWLYNDSPVKDHVVVNDRWGKGIRQHHGGYYTSEYESGMHSDHPWEECRGIGISFGYNSNEDLEDYATSQNLILMLADIVAKGGNLLLDIGPRADGKIPVIMQDRLTGLGTWLNINGEAIYATRPWRRSAQWTPGITPPKTDQRYLSSNYILRECFPEDDRYRRKSFLFTTKGNNLYAITPEWPKSYWILNQVVPTDSTRISLLETGQELTFSQRDTFLLVNVPVVGPQVLNPYGVYVLKVENIQGFLPRPSIEVVRDRENGPARVTISSTDERAQLYYTLDDAEPTTKSRLYKRPFTVRDGGNLKVKAFAPGLWPSETATFNIRDDQKFSKIQWDSAPDRIAEGDGLATVTDGLKASGDTPDDPQWVGFKTKDGEIVFDFGKTVKIKKVRIGFLQNEEICAKAPEEVRLEVSNNGWDYQGFKRLAPVPSQPGTGRREYETSVYNTNTRYLYIRLINPNVCKNPGGSWLYIDEITIE
ncbi:MAG: alpha-L-fucosidase [Saprospiraceae bacterium]|nr:alpha-L-fucosidase [Saprospiraceae bacterium]